MTDLAAHLAAGLDDRIDARYLVASAAASDYVRLKSAGILAACGLHDRAGVPLAAVQAALSVLPGLEFALAWLLGEAAVLGAVRIVPGAAGEPLYAAGEPVSPERRAQILAGVAAQAERVGSSLPMFDHVAERFPDYLQGRRSGHMILLKPPALQLWESYFSAANPLYDIHNQLGWVGLKAALLRLGRPARVLELGVGTGGGTTALLAGLTAEGAPRIESLTLSDVSPSFAINTAQRLAALAGDRVAIRHRRLDFNRPLVDQGVEPGSFDVLVGVNAIHNGGDLGATLAALAGALARDGFLVISESLCAEGSHVHQDFVFNLLPLPRPDLTTGSRFFSARIWRAELEKAGWRTEMHVNQQGPELALVALAQPS